MKTTEPTCPLCGNNRQVWTNQVTGRKRCHSVWCQIELEAQPSAEKKITDAMAQSESWAIQHSDRGHKHSMIYELGRSDAFKAAINWIAEEKKTETKTKPK